MFREFSNGNGQLWKYNVKVKNQASKRIDGAVTLIILYEVYRRYRNEFHKLIR